MPDLKQDNLKSLSNNLLKHIDIKLLRDAWEGIRIKNNVPGIDGIGNEIFEADLEANLSSLITDLEQGAYRVQSYREINITSRDGKKRNLYIPTLRDRVLQKAVLYLLEPIIEPLLHPCSYAYRKNLGVQDAVLKMTEYRDRGYIYVLQTDIRDFFESISHTMLFQSLTGIGVDISFQTLIMMWISPQNFPENRESKEQRDPDKGLPLGISVSPLLANFYLNPFDRHITEAGWKMVRYADDIAVCLKGIKAAEDVKNDVINLLQTLGLTINNEKTRIECFNESVDFLGAKITGKEVIPALPHPYEDDYKVPIKKQESKSKKRTIPFHLLRTLYIQSQGGRLGCHNSRFVVTKDQMTLIDIQAANIEQIYIFGRVHITSAAIVFCLKNHIPVYLFSGKGNYYGVLKSSRNPSLIITRLQLKKADDEKERLSICRSIVAAKIANSRQLLMGHSRNHPDLQLKKVINDLAKAEENAIETEEISKLRGIEGSSAVKYYEGLRECLLGGLLFNHRTRRPPEDPVNSLLSFGYALLFYNIQSFLLARGLDPAIGMYHKGLRNRAALPSDLIEEFRSPIVDSMVIASVNKGEFNEDDFYFLQEGQKACLLKDEARARFLEIYETKMSSPIQHPDVQFAVDWRRAIDLQVRRFKRYITGAVDSYTPFEWR